MILDRQQFAHHMKSGHHFADRQTPFQNPLWVPEQQHNARFEWFLRISMANYQTEEFWDFCHNTLQGKIGCFSSGMNTITGESWEWWGFTHKDDITLFVLRWS